VTRIPSEQSLSQYSPQEFKLSMLNEQKKFTIWSDELLSEDSKQGSLLYDLGGSSHCSKTVLIFLSELETVLSKGMS